MQKILILAANPKGTSQLRLDREVRDIGEGLQRAKHREEFILEQKWAVRPRDIQRAMLDMNPSIIHFSGHGTGDEGLVFEDETGSAKLIDGEALAGLFELFEEQLKCVVLNGCYSEVQATAIAQHIDYVIGTKKAIGDKAAIEFAVGFYDALGSGKPVEFAYKFGCAAIRLAGITEQLTPVLQQKASLVQSEIEGNIGEHKKGGTLVKPITKVDLRNFIVEAQFDNPYDGDGAIMENWTYGFAFIDNTTPDLNDPKRKSLDAWVNSKNKTWGFRSHNISLNGNLSNLNLSDKSSNKLRLTVNNKKAKFFVNDMYIETLDVSELTNKGSVFFTAGGGISGRLVQYQYKNLRVWSLDY